MVIGSDAAFLSAGLEHVQLSVHDKNTLEAGHFFFTGIAGLLSVAAISVFQMTDVVAAMAVEATGTSAACFDAAQYETFKPHRGMINAAGLIHQLIDGSQRTGSADGPVSPSFASIPAVHGPAADYVSSATK
jgi:histidine ammonia-lyase